MHIILSEKKLKLKVLAIGAEWCPDCAVHVPSMIKIIEALDDIALNENNGDNVKCLA